MARGRTAGRDRSRDDMSHALKLANLGTYGDADYDEQAIARALYKTSAKAQSIREKSPEQAWTYCERTAHKAIERARTVPPALDKGAAILRVMILRDVADSLPWGRRVSARRTLEGAFLTGTMAGLDFGLAHRTWAERTGQSREGRIKRNVPLLEGLGWFSYAGKDPGGANRYRLLLPDGLSVPRGAPEVSTWDELPLNHDAFRPKALGDAGWYVLHLAPGVQDREEIAARSGLRPSLVQEVLDQVAGGPLVPQLDRIARERGTAGALERDKEQHRTERETREREHVERREAGSEWIAWRRFLSRSEAPVQV
jgi:hypothetical protein